MNLKQMEHLLALAETGSFSRAAEQQHITQSALSRSIQLLEDELGARLIDRIGKRNELTPLGEVVAARARRVLFEAAELRRSADLLRQGELGMVCVGLGSGPAAVLMAPFLTHVANRHPGLRVNITRGSVELQLVQVRQRVLDALVVDLRSVVPAPDLRIEDLTEMRAGFVCRSGHPLLARRALSFEDMLRYPLASTPMADEVARMLVQRFGPRADPAQCVSLRCEDIASLIETVQASDAIYLGVVAAARARIAAGELVELATEPPMDSGARFAFVTLEGRTEAPAMAIFRRFVAAHLRDSAPRPLRPR